MPYVKKERRKEQDRPQFGSTGDLNYRITTVVNDYLAVSNLQWDTQWFTNESFATPKLNYTGINDCIGALECAKLELYRRISWYEDSKIKENGDVYEEHITNQGKQKH